MAADHAVPSTGRASGMRTLAARAITSALGVEVVADAYARRHARELRILAYHLVPDPAAFDRQLDVLERSYTVVGEAQVRAAIAGGPPLPERAVWITFDDGDPTVVDAGLPVLARRGLTATMYVCPGLVETGEAAWWTVVDAASRAGATAQVRGRTLQGRPLISALKTVPDHERREVVASLAPLAAGHLPERPALERRDLERWIDGGGTIGNHTWDHPCLDRCSASEQREQITKAHEWFLGFLGGETPTFAYPNGDRTDDAEAVLAELGYDTALLFDHLLAQPGGNPLRLSRLRLDTSDPPSRARAVVSGAHSAAFVRVR